MWDLTWQKGLCRCDEAKAAERETLLDCLGGPVEPTSPRERKAGRSESEEEVMWGQAQATVMLAEGEGGTTGQGAQVPSEPEKGRDGPPGVPRGPSPASTAAADPVRLTPPARPRTSDLQDHEEKNVCCLKPLNL